MSRAEREAAAYAATTQRVIRSLVTSIEGAYDRVVAPGPREGTWHYPLSQREADARFAAEMLEMLRERYGAKELHLDELVERACRAAEVAS